MNIQKYTIDQHAMDNQKEEFLTVDEAAKRLKVNKVTIYRMARKGQIPAVKFGKVWRISSIKLSELFNKSVQSE